MPKSKKSSKPNGHALSWKEPPVITRNRVFNFPGDVLKAKKGKWAVIRTSDAASQAAGYIRKRLGQLGMKGFEVTGRGKEVFARYTGK